MCRYSACIPLLFPAASPACIGTTAKARLADSDRCGRNVGYVCNRDLVQVAQRLGAREVILSTCTEGLQPASGSINGDTKAAQEVLDFCGAQDIAADVEVIPTERINKSCGPPTKSHVTYRFSTNMASLQSR